MEPRSPPKLAYRIVILQLQNYRHLSLRYLLPLHGFLSLKNIALLERQRSIRHDRLAIIVMGVNIVNLGKGIGMGNVAIGHYGTCSAYIIE
jgi:hypothetical protein